MQNKEKNYFSDAQLDVLAIERFTNIGFIQKNCRWYYEGKPIRIGEILPLPPNMEEMLPEDGMAIDVYIRLTSKLIDDKLTIWGECNLPDSVQLMISVRKKEIEYWAQDSVNVIEGNFSTQSFSNKGNKLLPGEYQVEITFLFIVFNRKKQNTF